MSNITRDIRIEWQRWIFRCRQRSAKAHDADRMAKAIIKANLKSIAAKKRLWVIKIAHSEYAILTKQQVRVFFNRIGLTVNYMQCNEYIVHITQKPS